MSAVCASFWHATGTVCSLPPAPVCSPAPGLASPSVHKYEAQHDYKNDTEDKHKTPTPKLWLVCGISATPVNITLLLPSNYTWPGSTMSRYVLSTGAVYLLYGGGAGRGVTNAGSGHATACGL